MFAGYVGSIDTFRRFVASVYLVVVTVLLPYWNSGLRWGLVGPFWDFWVLGVGRFM